MKKNLVGTKKMNTSRQDEIKIRAVTRERKRLQNRRRLRAGVELKIRGCVSQFSFERPCDANPQAGILGGGTQLGNNRCQQNPASLPLPPPPPSPPALSFSRTCANSRSLSSAISCRSSSEIRTRETHKSTLVCHDGTMTRLGDPPLFPPQQNQ